MSLLLKTIPKYKTRSEFEMEKILNKYKILSRRRQVAEVIENNGGLLTTEIIAYRVNQGIEYLKSKLNK